MRDALSMEERDGVDHLRENGPSLVDIHWAVAVKVQSEAAVVFVTTDRIPDLAI